MRTRLILVAIAGIAATEAALAQEMPWARSFDEAEKVAGQQKKLVMVDFYTDWWGWCKKLDATTYKDKEFIRRAGQVVPVLVNAEKEGKAIAAKYGVTGYPTILFVRPDGTVVYRMAGYLPTKPFLGEIHFAIDLDTNLSSYETKFQAHPNSLTLMEKLAMIYAKQNKPDQALPLIERAENLDPQTKGADLSEAFYAMGNYYQEKGSNDKAIEMFEMTLKTTRDDFVRADTLFNVAQSYAATHQTEKAETALKELDKQASAPDYYKAMAESFLKQLQSHH